ncbi:MAG: hypothetical protein JWP97_4592 [Labilithrix sp.]|nr:hypothetical protein [Labilithrix sp.]
MHGRLQHHEALTARSTDGGALLRAMIVQYPIARRRSFLASLFMGFMGAALTAPLLVGCGGAAPEAAAKAPAATTAADVHGPAPASAEAAGAAEQASAPSDAPPGRLVCRTTNAVDGTSELYLEWEGKEATGTLRQTTQSGMVHNQRVTAEREGNVILVDDPREHDDLVTHTAVLQQNGGSLQMRLGRGMSGTWGKCD